MSVLAYQFERMGKVTLQLYDTLIYLARTQRAVFCARYVRQ